MATAFVLFHSETGQETKLIKELKKIKEVKETYLVYGDYDIIAHIETGSMLELKEVVNWKLRRLENARSTLTMIAM